MRPTPILGLLLAVSALSACTTSQQLRMTRTQDATVVVDAPGGQCWSATVGMATHDGCGRQEISVHDDLGMFSSNVQKRGADAAEPWTLSISVMIDGTVRESNSTSAAYGVAQVVHMP